MINGLSLGSVYAIIALGYTMVYGIAKMLNFAHGDVIMVGGYISFIATVELGLPWYISVLSAMLVCTVLGILIERLAYKPLRNAASLAVLITAIGVSYLLQNIALLIWGSAAKSYQSLITLPAVVLFDGDLVIKSEAIVTILVCVVIMIALTIFTSHSKMGKAMRAVSEDKGAALLMGTTGSMPGIKAFTAAVFGGIGSIPGAMIGGLLLGIIQILGTAYISSELSDAIVFAVLIIVLLVKPTGLLGKKITEKV